MSGRGRGRGSAANKMPIPMSSIALNRNELNQNVQTPPELYPATFFRTIKIEPEEVDLFLVGIKQQLRTDFKNSQYFIKEKKVERTIDRYSDKYETILNQPTNETKVWNYGVFPDELKPKLKTKGKETTKAKKVTFEELKSKFEKLESNENAEDENVEDEEKDNEEEAVAELVEEDIEEETDYALSYFDNGEDYNEGSDDNLGDEATF